jgi:L-alanine-DL-glutamate epimerase-like enolase superfamily enzyme/pyrroloquinoline quinone (PQQ) biosynthesis protein C
MTVEETIISVLEETTAQALEDQRLRRLISGQMTREELRKFFRNFIPTHLSSVQILALLFSLAPTGAFELVRGNLLEEMGLEEGEKAHPDMLTDLAQGLGFSEQEIKRMSAVADESRRTFASAPMAQKTLRDMGLTILLEIVAFEGFLSRVSDRLADSLTSHYQLSTDAVKWFTLHGEVDVRHAEEGRQVVRTYISYYRFSESDVERIVGSTFSKNVILDRYFPEEHPSSHVTGPLRLALVEILPLTIPFARSFQHATMSRATSDAVIVRVTDHDGVRGYGEALPRPYVTGEDVATMVATLRSRVVSEVLAREFDSGVVVLEQVRTLAAAWSPPQGQGHSVIAWNATMCAMELALLDWAFRRAGQSLSEWLLPARDQVVYTGVIDATDPETAGTLASRYTDARFARLKVKVGIGDDFRRLEAVRQAAGDEVAVRVDANGVWDAASAVKALEALKPFNIEAVEQPVGSHDIEGMCRVREETGLAVIADESLVTMRDAENLIREQACDVFNVRVSKCGGLLPSRAIAELGLSAGLRVQVGAQVGETSLLSAAGRHLALHLAEVESVEGSFGTHLLSEDITAEPVMFGDAGRGNLVLGPGLGVSVDDQIVERLATDVIRMEG